jgi:hypothetical protein
LKTDLFCLNDRSLVGLAPQLKLARQTLITSRITRRATMTRFSLSHSHHRFKSAPRY